MTKNYIISNRHFKKINGKITRWLKDLGPFYPFGQKKNPEKALHPTSV